MENLGDSVHGGPNAVVNACGFDAADSEAEGGPQTSVLRIESMQFGCWRI